MAAVTRSARTIPSAPSTFSNHSVARCASPALPPAPRAIAGMPRAIGKLASVDELANSASRPMARVAAIAAWTQGLAHATHHYLNPHIPPTHNQNHLTTLFP